MEKDKDRILCKHCYKELNSLSKRELELNSIREIRGDMMSTCKLSRHMFLLQSKQSSISSNIKLFPNPVGRLINVSQPDKICKSPSCCYLLICGVSTTNHNIINSTTPNRGSTILLVRCCTTSATSAEISFPFPPCGRLRI